MSAMEDRATLVLGGSGFVGRHLVARLAAAGRRVIVPTRQRERAKHLILLPTVDVVEVDVHDEAVLARLARRQRQVLTLVFAMGMTVEEAAATLSISVGTARVHYDRGKRRLAGLIGAKERA